MTTGVRSFVLTAMAFALGFITSWMLNHRPSPGGTKREQICAEMAREVSNKCHEAERRQEIFEKKFPENSQSKDAKMAGAALKSQEWERSVAWAQACDDAKAQLEEAVLRIAEEP